MDGYDLLARNFDPKLKGFLNAASSKREIANTALWREFGGEKQAPNDLRIEQKERRVRRPNNFFGLGVHSLTYRAVFVVDPEDASN